MFELGKALRTARESKGLTVTQLADLTKLAPAVIDRLEAENFSEIAAPIYGRGFLRLYCEAVGLDPKPHIAEYMDIINGVREPVIHERQVSAAEPAAEPETPVPESEPAAEPEPEIRAEPANDAVADFTSGAIRGPSAEPGPSGTQFQADLFSANNPPVSPVQTPKDFASATDDATGEPSFSRYAAPIRHHNQAPACLAAYKRLAILAVSALALVALLVWGFCALYRVLSTDPNALPEPPDKKAADERVAAERVAAEPAAEAPVAQKRAQQKIPDLYID